MSKNYAKDTLGNFVFFDTALPAITGEKPQWWLWIRPVGSQWSPFRLIGESSDTYCQKNMHVPGMCEGCKRKRIEGKAR